MPISYKKRFSDGLKIVADFDFIEGRFECVRLEIRPAPNTGLKATDPRRVKLGEIKEWVRRSEIKSTRKYAQGIGFPPDWSKTKAKRVQRHFRSALPLWEAEARRGGPGGRNVERSPELVARVYAAGGSTPRQAVVKHFHLSPSGADKAIKRAVKAGYLIPTNPGEPHRAELPIEKE